MNHFLSNLAFLLCLNVAATGSPGDSPKPNVLIIIADDMGFSDAGCYGGEIHTPNLDKLATGGLRFTQFYNTARCWSSRASLLSGYYAQAIRRDVLTGDFKPKMPNSPRPRWAQLLPAYLKPLGYHSYFSGKWHIDGTPLESGFEHTYDSTSVKGFFDASGHREDNIPVPPGPKNKPYYATIATADHAIKYLDEHAAKYPGQPFFQYLAFNAPHFPLHALPEDIEVYKDRYTAGWDALRKERYDRMKKLGIVNCALSPLDSETIPAWNLAEEVLKKRIGPEEVGHAVSWESLTDGQKKFQASKMAVHAAMVHRMDIEIGRVLDKLESMGVRDNTIVFFMSDNGASAEQIIRGGGHDPAAPVGSEKTFLGIGPGWSSVANTPFRLHKSWNHEGGITTPLIVNWPIGINDPKGLRTDPGHLIDIVPTVLELAGGKQPESVAGLTVPPLQGMSLVPDFIKDGSVKHEYLWWNHDGHRAIRMGDWKLVDIRNSQWELYDMIKDRSETKDLASEHPEKVKQLENAWQQHANEFHALALQDLPVRGKAGKKAGGEEE